MQGQHSRGGSYHTHDYCVALLTSAATCLSSSWGRRLAKRFGVDATYEAEAFTVVSDGRSGFVDHEALKPEKVAAAQRKLFSAVDDKRGGVLIAYGWTMAEDLVKLGAR